MQLKTVATFPKPEEAHNFRAFLEGNGIQAFVRDEETGASYSLAIGGIRVDVAETDFDRAKALYSSTPPINDDKLEAEAAAGFLQKTKTSDSTPAMNAFDRERAIFRAIVKGIGVYQLIMAFEDLYIVAVGTANLVRGSIINPSHVGEYATLAAFRCGAALLLLYGTDFFCWLAFPPRSSTSARPLAEKDRSDSA